MTLPCPGFEAVWGDMMGQFRLMKTADDVQYINRIKFVLAHDAPRSASFYILFLLNQAAFAYQTTAPTCFQQRAHHPCTYIIHILIKLRSPEFLFFWSPRISEHLQEPCTQYNDAGLR